MTDARVSELTEHLDLMCDEFRRIACCPGSNEEIRGLCARAVAVTHQHVPLIEQRNRAERERDAALAALAKERALYQDMTAGFEKQWCRAEAAEARCAGMIPVVQVESLIARSGGAVDFTIGRLRGEGDHRRANLMQLLLDDLAAFYKEQELGTRAADALATPEATNTNDAKGRTDA